MSNFNEKLIEEKCIDHYIIKKEVNLNNNKIYIYSINIAQLSHIRTMTMYNKLNCFLKNYEVPIEQKIIKKFFNEMSFIILKYKLENIEIEEGMKEEIKDPAILKDISSLLDNIPFIHVYLRKYIPKDQFKTDPIFKKRFKKTNYIYFDIIFQEESIATYKKRVFKTIQHLVKDSKYIKNVIFCFQEIYPLIEFLDIIYKFKDLVVIDPKINNEKKIDDKLYKVLFFKSNNILITKKCPFTFYRIDNGYDLFLNFFNHKRQNGEIDRNINQNIKYYIKELDLYLYNIHSYLYCDKRIKTMFYEKFIPYFKNNLKKKIILIGDFNFQMKEETKKILEEKLQEEKIFVEFYPNPFSLKKINYDGIIMKL